ncbi:MAG: efflux RND transporter periplasmic adaptor subunit [Tidjanibacter sp.]|nr:efflux RND transporter periplasmic adaptor subunit [Tidjanibacter sp.]
MSRSKRDKVLEVLFFVVVGIVAVVSVAGLALATKRPVVIQGQIEAYQVMVAGKLAGRIDSIYVAEGDHIERGDTLVSILSPEAVAKQQQAEALESAARYQSQKIDRGTRSEIVRSAEQAWQGAKAQLALAEKSYHRIERLWADSVVSLQRRDEGLALYQSAQAAESVARQQYLMAVTGAEVEDRKSAQAMVEAAAGVVGQVDAVLQDSHLRAPQGGIVSAIYPTEGELVGVGTPLVEIVDLARAYAVLMVREELMPMFRVGSRFEAAVPAIGAKQVEFEVYYIAPLGSYATWRATRQSGGYDMRTFEIHARPTEPTEGLRAGMSVLLTLPHSATEL